MTASRHLTRMNGTNWRGSVTVVVPALNEEANLRDAVDSLLTALEQCAADWEILIVNDGSTDSTPILAGELSRRDPRIRVLHHDVPRGIGFSFREGVAASTKDAITWMPGDGENEPQEVLKWLPVLAHVDIVNPFVINRSVRSRGRRVLSTLYLWIVNLAFGTTFNYTNGNVIYRRRVFDVVTQMADGFSFQLECLVKAVRAGFTFAEVPVRLLGRKHGKSKAVSFKSFRAVVRDFLRLFVEVRFRSGARHGSVNRQ